MERQEWSALLVDGGLDAAARHAHDEVLLQRHRDHLIEALQPCTAHSRHSRHSRSSSARRRLEKCAGVRECSAGRAVARGGWSRVEGSPEPAPPRPRGPRGPRQSHPRRRQRRFSPAHQRDGGNVVAPSPATAGPSTFTTTWVSVTIVAGASAMMTRVECVSAVKQVPEPLDA